MMVMLELILKKCIFLANFIVSNFEALFKVLQMKKGIGPWELALNLS